jgi:hypothetical protein
MTDNKQSCGTCAWFAFLYLGVRRIGTCYWPSCHDLPASVGGSDARPWSHHGTSCRCWTDDPAIAARVERLTRLP